MRLFMIFFLLLALAVLFLSNYFVFSSLIQFYSITNNTIKIVLGLVLAFFAISFILSHFIARVSSGLLTKFYYFLANAFLGFLLYLLLFSALSWLIYSIGRGCGKNIPMNFILSGFIILSLIICIYGYYNSRQFKIKNITVGVKDLPDKWNNKTILHLSDLHLGVLNSESLVKKINDSVNDAHPDIVLITGDYYDGTSPKYKEFAEPLESINSTYGIYMVTGNHETYITDNFQYTALKDAGVKVLWDEIIDIDGLKLIGIDYPGHELKKDISSILNRVNRNDFNVLLYHEPKFMEEAKEAGVDLQLAGHAHAGQIWPINYITRLIYKKFYYGLNSIGDYNIYTTSGCGTWGPPLRVGIKGEIVAIKLTKK